MSRKPKESNSDTCWTPPAHKRDKTECKFCGIICGSKNELIQHISKEHKKKAPSTNTEPETCNICGTVYANLGSLRHHTRKFHPEIKLIREKAQNPGNGKGSARKAIKRSFNDSATRTLDSSKKSYECKFCGKIMNLKRHLNSHTNKWHKKVSNSIIISVRGHL